MKISLLILVLILSSTDSGFCQSDHQMKMGDDSPVELVKGLGSYRHTVSTKNPEAQLFFDQGLAYVYAFNHDEAVRSFQRAAELDPDLAMAYWGIGLALGPNINLDVDPAREKAAYEAVQKALALAPKASEKERAYISALAKRYSADPNADLKKLAVDYKNAMGKLVERYAGDLDATTLYAESAMDLRPWQLWNADGTPAPGTLEIIEALESVLRRYPDHVGAIHYYIHAVEASPNPERALPYVAKLPELMPAAGHLVHMPAHIYERTGDYAKAAQSNRDAALADQAYIKSRGIRGVYPLMYYSHNLHFLAIASSMSGRFSDSINAAKQLQQYLAPYLKEMPMLEGFMSVSPLLLVDFQKWSEIDKLPQPDASHPGLNAVWHYARGMSLAARGRKAAAEREYVAMSKWEKEVPEKVSYGLNNARKVLQIADLVLKARIARLNRNHADSIDSLRKAGALEDALAYDEPPAWFTPVRVYLGFSLLKDGNYSGAEQVFREDLEKNRRSGRSLFGLAQSLKAQKKTREAAEIEKQFMAAWKIADTKLTTDQF